MKIAFRNAIQDFIADGTPNTTYKEYMTEMSNLFRLQDNVLLKASKERAKSGIGKWIKENPNKARAIGWGGRNPYSRRLI